MKHSSSNATTSALDAETSALDVETSAFGAATSAIARRSFDAKIARSYRRYRRGATGDIGDCGVVITPQMCNRVTNHGDMSIFSKPARNRVTPVSIQDGVQHGITFAAISTIPAAKSPIPRSYRRFLRSYRRSLRRCRNP